MHREEGTLFQESCRLQLRPSSSHVNRPQCTQEHNLLESAEVPRLVRTDLTWSSQSPLPEGKTENVLLKRDSTERLPLHSSPRVVTMTTVTSLGRRKEGGAVE
ncbi:hypothetical protein SKAU_G00334150 [Synaphobranchus kaupii]|uniref:Uncharacterized protein n=1 Tax=Synaphobranchus kaupii TaxID=118154 RepID=A0A9Q1ELT1_SYNKA|nr:hypothetical protein SKAU_G00334150 [Synaphobranchus kaupii]